MSLNCFNDKKTKITVFGHCDAAYVPNPVFGI